MIKPRGRVWSHGVFPAIPGVADSEYTGKTRWFWCCFYCLEWSLTHWEPIPESYGGCARTPADGRDYLKWHTEGLHDSATPKHFREIK